jgi:hypothetical protein
MSRRLVRRSAKREGGRRRKLSAKAAVAALAIALAWPAGASAHRLGEYLQAARVSLERTRVLLEIDLTPGASVAATVVPLIDRDGDGLITPAEISRYGRDVLADVAVTLDGRALAMELVTIDAPTLGELREGMGTIRLRATSRADVRWGTHDVSVRNQHLAAAASVYMVNALMPDDSEIAVLSQVRDARQSSARITYQVGPDWIAQLAWLSIGVGGLGVLVMFRRRLNYAFASTTVQ